MVATLKLERKLKAQADAFFKKARRTAWGTGKQVKAGFPEERVSEEIIERAVYNEFGTKTIPERPFMRNAQRDGYNANRRLMRAHATLILRGEMTKKNSLTIIGMKMVADLQQSIRSNTPPPNADATVERKGSSSTLIDTGDMLKAATFWIEE